MGVKGLGSELFGVGGGGEPGFDSDPRVQRGADDPAPAELGEVDRHEAGRVLAAKL